MKLGQPVPLSNFLAETKRRCHIREGAGALFMIQGAAAGRLRTMRAHDSILFRREKAPPLFLGMGNFKSFAWHSVWPQFKPTKKASYIQIGDVQCVFLDEFAAGLDNIAH